VPRLLFGSIDFQLDLGVHGDELLPYRSQLVLASRVAGIGAPVDGVTTAINDAAAVRRDAQGARALGFGGKLRIHPQQVAIVNDAFRPTGPQIAWAQRVVAADAQAGGAAVAVEAKWSTGRCCRRRARFSTRSRREVPAHHRRLPRNATCCETSRTAAAPQLPQHTMT
jgi:citrate lyase subunit beta/citryl-CoA lyase